MVGYIIMKNSCFFFSDFYLNSEVPLFSDARAIRRVDSYEVGAPLLDEASNTELPHSVWTASFSDNGFAYLPNQFVLLQPYQCAFFFPWHWIYCKKYRFWLCAVSSACYLFIVCHKWCSRQAHKMSFTLTCYQCFAAVSWCHWRSSSIVASSLPCALSLLPNVPAISGSVHYHHIVSLQFLAPKICATPWKILFFGCLGHSKPLQ